MGRASEIAELEEAFRQADEERTAACVTVVGPMGVGKSRLVYEFLLRATANNRQPRIYRGAAHDGDSGFGMFAQLLRARFGITEQMDLETQKQKLHALVCATLDDRKVGDVCFFLGRLLQLDFPRSSLIDAISSEPEELRHLSRLVMKRFFEADALAAGPGAPCLVLVFDDVHHASPDALDLLSYLSESFAGPILVVALGRPELLARADTFSSPRFRKLDLSTLSEGDAAFLVEDLLQRCEEDAPVDELVDAACALGGGNPALLERTVRAFFDLGVLVVKEDQRWAVHADRLDRVRLPLTVHDAVAARIGALSPEERELLQRAAVMGGVFWLGGLVALGRASAPVDDIWTSREAADVDTIQERLAELVSRDYLLRLPDSTFPNDEEYVFKHNLEREALSRMLPSAQARKAHHAVADWLSFRDNVRSHEEYLSMLARHREAAGLTGLAALTYLAAGDVARDAYANAKAAEHYRKGLSLCSAGGDIDAEVHLNALHHLGDVLHVLGKNEEALALFREMLERAYRLDLRGKGGAAHSRIGRLHRDSGLREEAGRHLEAARALFESIGDERGIASAIDDIGKLCWLRGEYQNALEHTQRALAMRRKIGDRRSIALSLNNLGLAYQDSGHFKLALEAFEQALAIRRDIGDLVGVSTTLNNLGTIALDQRDDARALGLFTDALEVARDTGDRARVAVVLINLGETQTRLGNPTRAIGHLDEAGEITRDLGDKLGMAEAMRGLGKAHLAAGDVARARDLTQQAVDTFRETRGKVQLGAALRDLGEVLASGAPGTDALLAARGHLLQSIWIFEEIGNDVELARSCRVYADLLQKTQDYQTDPATRQEADEFRKRSEEIFAKLRISSLGFDADAFFAVRGAT